MTYDGERLRKRDWLVRDVPTAEARAFIAEYHYSKGSSLTRVYSHGLFRKDSAALMGVAIWLPPTRVAAESVNRGAWQKVLSLTRLACRPDAPRNAATFLLGASIRLIRADRRFVSLVTYADTRYGHTGAIYRASNWDYVGCMKGSCAWRDPATGRQVARKATRSRTDAEMLALGYERLPPSDKHKFVLHLREDS
jgi:hypothetical protein